MTSDSPYRAKKVFIEILHDNKVIESRELDLLKYIGYGNVNETLQYGPQKNHTNTLLFDIELTEILDDNV